MKRKDWDDYDWDDYEESRGLKEVLSERYDFIKYLGGGGFGRVFLLKDRRLHRKVALKVLRLTEYDEDEREEIKVRFQTEAIAYAQCMHPNIASIFDVEHNENFPHFFIEYIEGKDLDSIIKVKGKLDWEEALRVSEGVLTGLDYLHKKDLVHRDIKPKNIMVDEKSKKIVIIDLGITKNLAISSKSKISAGTPYYMAPEQFDVEMGVTSKIDIYSFGVVLYEMLTGKLPFKGRNQAQIMNEHLFKTIPNIRVENPNLPAGTEEIIFKAMAKKPEERYQSAMSFLNDLKYLEKIKTEKLKGLADKDAIEKEEETGDEKIGEEVIEKEGEKISEEVVEKDDEKEIEVLSPDALLTEDEEKKDTTPQEVEIPEKKGLKKPIPIKYLTWILLITVAILFIILDPLNIMNEKAKKTNGNDEYQYYFKMAGEFLGKGDYEKARYYLNNARILKNTDETQALANEIARREQEIKNGKKEYDAIKDQPDIPLYLEFKRKYPKSSYLKDLQDRLKKKDKALPLEEEYWDSMQKNKKGYYESTFIIGDEKNEHRMIYIPEKKFWIDKYEVSWLQFRKLLQAERMRLPTRKNKQYIKEEDEYPAVVTYENAERYCKRYGFRLPTGAEWEYAAGKEELTYPWGNELPDDNGVFRANFDSFEDGYEGTAPVNSFEEFTSPFEAVNMAGNAWEWVQGNLLKGGGFFSDKRDLEIEKEKPGKSGIEEGFRCIKEEKHDD